MTLSMTRRDFKSFHLHALSLCPRRTWNLLAKSEFGISMEIHQEGAARHAAVMILCIYPAAPNGRPAPNIALAQGKLMFPGTRK